MRMIENMEQNPDVWNRLFPDPERQRLARTFIKQLTAVDGVEKVVALKSEATGDHTLHVMVKELDDGSPRADFQAWRDVRRMHSIVCPSERERRLLGGLSAMTEASICGSIKSIIWLSEPRSYSALAKSAERTSRHKILVHKITFSVIGSNIVQ